VNSAVSAGLPNGVQAEPGEKVFCVRALVAQGTTSVTQNFSKKSAKGEVSPGS